MMDQDIAHSVVGALNAVTGVSVSFHDIGQLNFTTPTTVKIEVQPVAGETNTNNNSADYPVIFSVA